MTPDERHVQDLNVITSFAIVAQGLPIEGAVQKATTGYFEAQQRGKARRSDALLLQVLNTVQQLSTLGHQWQLQCMREVMDEEAAAAARPAPDPNSQWIE